MEEFKVPWVKHYGWPWPEIIVHDQGPEFMGSEFQNPARAAGVLTMPIDSQSPWQNGQTDRERDSHSNTNCGTWTKSATLNVRRSLKRQWPSVVTQGTVIAIGRDSLRISACLVPACVCLEAC